MSDLHILFQYYGLDWLAMTLSLLAVYWLGNRLSRGFVAFIFANLLWLGVGTFLMQSAGIALGNLIFLIINIRGYLRWQKTPAHG